MYVFMCMCMYACMYVCMYVCMYLCACWSWRTTSGSWFSPSAMWVQGWNLSSVLAAGLWPSEPFCLSPMQLLCMLYNLLIVNTLQRWKEGSRSQRCFFVLWRDLRVYFIMLTSNPQPSCLSLLDAGNHWLSPSHTYILPPTLRNRLKE